MLLSTMDDRHPSSESHHLPEDDLYELSFDIEAVEWRRDLQQKVIESARERSSIQGALKIETKMLARHLEELAQKLKEEDRDTRQQVIRNLYWKRHEIPVNLLTETFGLSSEDRLVKRAGPLELQIPCSVCGMPIRPRYRRRLRAVLNSVSEGSSPRCYTCWYENTVGHDPF